MSRYLFKPPSDSDDFAWLYFKNLADAQEAVVRLRAVGMYRACTMAVELETTGGVIKKIS